MKGDFSRNSFNPTRHYAGVMMQQGRVQLDADWNEQQSIAQYRFDTSATDLIGQSGAPLHDAGFALTTPDGLAITIGAGRYYVGGLLCENEAAIDYTQQPDLPAAPAIAAQLQAAGTTVALLYLEAWYHAVSALDDPEIREVALGGPDTAMRAKTVWQVKALPVTPGGSGSASCGDTFAEWDALLAPGTGLLSARAQPTTATGNPCLLPPGAGYQLLENQLYRVEIHEGGPLGTATFKWSRDNGSVMTAIEAFDGLQIIVHDLGRDAAIGLGNGQIVELVDDLVELSGQPGQLFQIDHVVEESFTVVLTTAPAAIDLHLHPKLRRWDAPLAVTGAVTTPDGWTVLEGGVQVEFAPGIYLAGDYWTVAARTVTADIDWPFTVPQKPQGNQRHRARLGIASLSGGKLAIQDCRRLFTPLAETPAAVHVTAISWLHDDVMGQAQLQASGLQVFFDGAVTPPPAPPTGMSQAVMAVTLEAPVSLKTINPAADAASLTTMDLPLRGDITFPASNAMLWKPGRGGAELGNLLAFLVSEQIQQARLRVSLRGTAIWFDGPNARLYLDGRTLGQDGFRADGTSPRIDLQFPSGEGRRSSDFESWLYVQLQLPPVSLVAISVTPPLINAGGTATATVTLDHPAAADGVTVTLASSSAVVIVPPSVQVAVGAVSAVFNITSSAAPNTLGAIITASAGNAVVTAPLTVQVVNVALSPAEVSIFQGHSQQFLATVTGSGITDVSWSVQQGRASISATGLFTGATLGDFIVVATSAADPARTGTASVHVLTKSKDKEKEKEKDSDKIKKEADKFVSENISRLNSPEQLAETNLAPSAAAPGRAFIQPAQRPVQV